MKKILSILVLILLTFQTPSQADDIRDFQIEGMSLGDSLLDYFNKEKIENEKKTEYVYVYKDNKFMELGIGGTKAFPLFKKLKIYEELSVAIKPNDKTYKIYGITGEFYCKNDISICFSKKEEVVSSLKDFFGNEVKLDIYEKNHRVDKTGNSMVYGTQFLFKSSKDNIAVSVYDWSEKLTEEKRWVDNLKVDISTEEFVNFLLNEAYK